MGVGHLAIALGLKKFEPKANLGLLFFACLLLDFLLGIFFFLGLEQIFIPENFSEVHYLTFSFPYSHGLTASLFWSILVFLLAKLVWREKSDWKIPLALSLAVFSHFILDFIVHIAELPLFDRNSLKLGLGLWNHLFIALTLEMLLVALSLLIYLLFSKAKNAIGKYGILALMIIFSILTILGMTTTAPPSSFTGIAASWLIVPLVFGALGFWFDGKRTFTP